MHQPYLIYNKVNKKLRPYLVYWLNRYWCKVGKQMAPFEYSLQLCDQWFMLNH